MAQDIPLAEALLLYNAGFRDETPAFVVRPLGHDDYYRYDFQIGACFREWKEIAASGDKDKLLARMFIDIWHIVAFYKVPVELVHEGMLVVPEYRDMLADDCLPKQFQYERN